MRRINLSPMAAAMSALLIALSASLNVRAQDQTGSIHGHVTKPEGIPMTDGIVSLGPVGQTTAKYAFNTDSNGDYKGSGIAPGSYTATLRVPNMPAEKDVDQVMEVKITAGSDTLQNFDMTRPDYLAKMTPELRKQVEEAQKQNASVIKEASAVKNLNANLTKAREDNKNKNYAEADSLMTEATQTKPDASLLWFELGIAQNGEAKYDEAVISLKKAIDLDAASKKPSPELQGEIGNALGEALARQKKIPEAQAAYDAAAAINHTQAARYYQNEAIVMYQTVKDLPATLAAANKAIQADPNQPLPYYFKAQALVPNTTTTGEGNNMKYVMPPGCAEAYQKYLDLAPNGQFAAEVKGILTGMNQKITSNYKAKK